MRAWRGGRLIHRDAVRVSAFGLPPAGVTMTVRHWLAGDGVTNWRIMRATSPQ
jgi:hypothetical protein